MKENCQHWPTISTAPWNLGPGLSALDAWAQWLDAEPPWNRPWLIRHLIAIHQWLSLDCSEHLPDCHCETYLFPKNQKFDHQINQWFGFVWKCCVPRKTQWLMIIIPTKNGYFIGNTPHFQTYPFSFSISSPGLAWVHELDLTETKKKTTSAPLEVGNGSEGIRRQVDYEKL